ncbi:hypothetical protein CEUSTIGMA_g11973.t1 [Chlamydomonas eustigma]|uniref:NADH:ubiquinone reductase (non-electrogenic) n=1 Tax=Chlamydomonas eustigma TaxID=1157962 RepID=A0A250XNR8_9CHLO|nr:hypothetical protein CEUSTIGMA_g11973.t1 [Chlamydomonas eustigma]|eukprot:GAX84552.1 hypothetical protein CEUSTIGMA_g11973.t1 [Chlamydomonas eustigma]
MINLSSQKNHQRQLSGAIAGYVVHRPVAPVLSTPAANTRFFQSSTCNSKPSSLSPPSALATDSLEGMVKPSRSVITARPRVVVLGSGWASMSFVKSLPSNISEKYDIVLVSPRNYFLYTPLLPAVATGTCEERSIVEPVRNLINGKAEFIQAFCKEADPASKTLMCCFPADQGFPEACFKLSYDVLIIGVGTVNNTFGIQGVAEHCNFFKSIEDASALRARVSECFERAALPGSTDEERKKLLSFVIVGGGPTGVEVAAELYDMINDDVIKLYPSLKPFVAIRIVELMDHVLSTYDRKISLYTADQFKRAGIKLVLNSRVASVGDGVVTVVNKQNQAEEIPFGACVWATGIAMNPLIKQLQPLIPGQNHFRSILTDEYMCVNGSGGSIYAFGDSSTIDQPKALSRTEELFEKGDVNKDNVLSVKELRDVLLQASKEFPHLEEHARFLDSRTGGFSRFGNLVAGTLGTNSAPSDSPVATVEESHELTKEEFKTLLGKIDSGLRALPATAQVAQQQGAYLANLFAKNKITGNAETSVMGKGMRSFGYFHKGSAAYVGSDNAVFDVPMLGPLTGKGAGLVWKGFETYSQFSFRNKCLVASDWLRTKLFGRDISRV